MLAPCFLGRAIGKLRKLEHRLPSQRMRLAVPFAYKSIGLFKSIRPRQNPDEIADLYERICDLAPQRVLEIGTAKGGSLYLWTQAADPHAVLVSADLPGGDFGGGYPPGRTPLYQSFAQPNQTLHLLRVDSHQAETKQTIDQLFGGKPIDFAFIDGDHTYNGVRADFLDYGPLVRPGGMIAFHDILPQPQSPQTQVHTLWQQIEPHHETWRFVDERSDYGHIGIGLLRVGPNGICTDGLDAAPSTHG